MKPGVAHEHAGQFASAVQAEIERVERSNAAGVNHLRAALAEVILGVCEKFAGQRALAMVAANHQLVGCADVGGYCALFIVSSESGMDEADWDLIVQSDDQA